jgi:hypothetical protein
MGRKSVSKKAKKGKEKAQERKKKEIAKKVANDANVELSEEEEDDDDIVPILMKKCKMTEEEVIAAHQNFLEKCPGGEMSKEEFLHDNEVKMSHVLLVPICFNFQYLRRTPCYPRQCSKFLTRTLAAPWTSSSTCRPSRPSS